MNFMAVGPHCWGKGTTIEEAVKNARQNWPRAFSKIKRPSNHHFSLYSSEGEFSIDGLGRVSCTQPITKIQTSSLAVEEG